MISIALYKPDIPQNTASILRLCACFGIKMHIIEPCGFNLSDNRFKRVIMDYIKLSSIIRYENFEDLVNKNKNSRIILNYNVLNNACFVRFLHKLSTN